MEARHPLLLARLVATMQERGIRPKELARRAGLNDAAVYDLLSRRVSSPRFDSVIALARVLDVSVEWLGENPESGLLVQEKVPEMASDPPKSRSEVTNELLFETLKAIQATLARQSEDLREIKSRLGILEMQYASLSNRVDRIDERLARVEKRLELIDA